MPVSEGCWVDDGAIFLFKIIFYEKKKNKHQLWLNSLQRK